MTTSSHRTEADDPGTAARRRRSGRHQRSIERHDDVRADPLGHGRRFPDARRHEPAINTPQSVKAITFWSDLYLKHKVTPEGTPNFTTTRDIQPLFEANKVGMLTASSNAFDTFSTNQTSMGRRCCPRQGQPRRRLDHGHPRGRGQSQGRQDLPPLAVPARDHGQGHEPLSVNRKALDLPPWNDPAKAIFKQAEIDGRSVPSVAGWFKMQEAIIVELQRVLVGQKTPQQAADTAAARMADIIAESK